MPIYPAWRSSLVATRRLLPLRCPPGKPSSPAIAAPTHALSKSTSIPKNLQRVRDHGFDGYMEVQKKVRRALKLQKLILAHQGATLPVARLDALARRHLGLGQHEAGSFLLKHPHVFHVYEHPVQRVLWVRLTPRATRQTEEEALAVQEMLPDAILRLCKLLLLSNSGRLRLKHVRVARHDLGLPDDFEHSVVLTHPGYFRLVGDAGGGGGGMVLWGRRWRRRGIGEEEEGSRGLRRGIGEGGDGSSKAIDGEAMREICRGEQGDRGKGDCNSRAQ